MTQPKYSRTVLACLFVFSAVLSGANVGHGQEIPVGPIQGVRPIPSPIVADKKPVDLLNGEWDSKSQIDWDVAATLALLSKTAYEKDDELMGFVASGMGFTSCQNFNRANSAAHVLVGDDV